MATQLTQVTFPNGDYIISDNQPAVKQFVGGKIVNFNDGSSLPMPKLEIAVEPQQDLHGYDSPWVGGAGKNKANPDLLLNGYTNPSNRKYDNTTMAKTQFVKTEGLSTITISATNGNRCYVCYYNDIPNVGDEASTNVTQVATSLPQTITVDSSYTYVAIQVCYNSSGANVSNVQVESGNQATTFAPYSNECPISGWSAVDVSVVGNNWCPVSSGEIKSGNLVTFSTPLPSGTYSISLNATRTGESSSEASIIVYDKDDNAYTAKSVMPNTGNKLKIENQNFNNGISRIYFYSIAGSWGQSQNYTLSITDFQLELGSTATAYEPYNPNSETITIQLGDTYYGGKLRIVNGVAEFVADRAEIDLGSRTYIKAIDGYFYTYISDISIINFNINEPTAECEIYKLCVPSEWYARTIDSSIFGVESSHVIYVADTRFSDGDSLKTALAGKKLVYTLATPITIPLGSVSISSLLGVNNIWADCGDIIKVEYVRDKYDKITAKISEYADKANTAIDTQTVNRHTVDKDVPSDAVFTDTNNAVTQTPTTTDATYELLFSGSANNTESTERARKSQYATFNPSKQAFTFGTRLSGSTVGTNSYAEGKDVTASGYYSHAEGNGTVASGSQGHAEGYMTIANGVNTHAEGFETTVSGTCSHAEGERTIANHASQHVFGEYNIPDPSTATASRRGNYVEIVGNGDVSDPSNARTLDWDGNETLAGSLNINGGNVNLGTSSSDSDDSGDIAFFYGNGQEKARIYAANEFTSYDSLNYRCYKKDGTYLGTTKLFTTMGGTMGGKITFNQSTKNAIAYQGTKATYDLIKFIDNTADAMGNGIAIGGGGQTIIGGGESADTMIAQAGTSGEENMWIGNDGAVHIFSNLQSGWSSRQIFIFGTNGGLTVPAGISCGGSVAASVSSGEVQLMAKTNGKTCYLFHNGTNMGLYSNNSGGAIIIKNHSSNQLTINGATYSVSNSANFRSAIGAAASSSRITKKDIKDITDDEARKILKVDVKSFKYKDAFINKQDIQRDKYYGVIAEDVLKTIPYVVNVPQDYDESKVDPEKGLAQDLLTIDYDKFVPYLIKMIQLQQKEIEELKAKI